MKKPKYLSIQTNPSASWRTMTVTIRVKWWEWFVLVAKAINKRIKTKWYLWPVVWLYHYPKIACKLALGIEK